MRLLPERLQLGPLGLLTATAPELTRGELDNLRIRLVVDHVIPCTIKGYKNRISGIDVIGSDGYRRSEMRGAVRQLRLGQFV